MPSLLLVITNLPSFLPNASKSLREDLPKIFGLVGEGVRPQWCAGPTATATPVVMRAPSIGFSSRPIPVPRAPVIGRPSTSPAGLQAVA